MSQYREKQIDKGIGWAQEVAVRRGRDAAHEALHEHWAKWSLYRLSSLYDHGLKHWIPVVEVPELPDAANPELENFVDILPRDMTVRGWKRLSREYRGIPVTPPEWVVQFFITFYPKTRSKYIKRGVHNVPLSESS